MSDSGTLGRLLERARRRSVANKATEQLAWSAGTAMGGAILLLLLGTQILDWYWPLLLFTGGLGWGAWRVWRGVPALYEIAQRMDGALGLHDTLSTAHYYSLPAADGRGDAAVVEGQRQAAERIASELDARAAVPIAVPRSLWTATALAMGAAGLFGLRYGLTHSLDLRPPLAKIVFDTFRGPVPRQAALRKKGAPLRLPDFLDQMGLSLNETTPATPSEVQSNSPLRGVDGADGGMRAPAGKSGENLDGVQDGVDPGEAVEDGSEASADEQDGSAGASPPEKTKSLPPSAGRQVANSSGEESDLMQKLRDAMSKMLSRLHLTDKLDSSLQAAASQGGAPGEKRQQGASKQGMRGQGRKEAGDAAEGERQGESEGQGSEKMSNGRNQGLQGSDRPPSREGRSGIGREDGVKDLKEAEQLAAMGKLSEILGRRSANLSGEVTVEVASGKQQQLRTAYSQKSARHDDSGSDSSRDEIPLVYQQYVEQYFSEVRKSPPAP